MTYATQNEPSTHADSIQAWAEAIITAKKSRDIPDQLAPIPYQPAPKQ